MNNFYKIFYCALLMIIMGCRLPKPDLKGGVINNTDDTLLATIVNPRISIDTFIVNTHPIEFVLMCDIDLPIGFICNSRQKLDTNSHFFKNRYEKQNSSSFYNVWDDSKYLLNCKYCITIDSSQNTLKASFKFYPEDNLDLMQRGSDFYWDTIHFAGYKYGVKVPELKYRIELNGKQAIGNVLIATDEVEKYNAVFFIGGRKKN